MLVPIHWFQRTIAGNNGVSQIFVSARAGVDTTKVQSDITRLRLSAAVGVVFGYFPARRASLQDPIEALRHE